LLLWGAPQLLQDPRRPERRPPSVILPPSQGLVLWVRLSRSKKGGVRRGKELPGKGYYPGITLEERIRMKKRTKVRMSNIRLRALTGRQGAYIEIRAPIMARHTRQEHLIIYAFPYHLSALYSILVFLFKARSYLFVSSLPFLSFSFFVEYSLVF